MVVDFMWSVKDEVEVRHKTFIVEGARPEGRAPLHEWRVAWHSLEQHKPIRRSTEASVPPYSATEHTPERKLTASADSCNFF
ncbi:hypothetical protein NDU88_002213 [Pleurodeles waltl]|uniref:Uncharacterized protein n=1 Tax=Pleurodeles waltl TaxID=8319 RepID=A0AAV7P878_PLEWA|nr:hypothetical protein NDU88_002213 [Pleurodeles waltl]